MEQRSVNRRNLMRTTGLAVAGAVGVTVAQAVPVAAAGFGFTPITPYRSIDTRPIPGLGKLPSGSFDDWDVWTDEFGTPRIPQSAAAVTFNLTATATQGVPGFLTIYPAGQPTPNVSTLNWVTVGADVANGGTVALGPSPATGAGSVSVLCGGVPAAATHYIIDITGYYS
jgi:hypothetical protein